MRGPNSGITPFRGSCAVLNAVPAPAPAVSDSKVVEDDDGEEEVVALADFKCLTDEGSIDLPPPAKEESSSTLTYILVGFVVVVVIGVILYFIIKYMQKEARGDYVELSKDDKEYLIQRCKRIAAKIGEGMPMQPDLFKVISKHVDTDCEGMLKKKNMPSWLASSEGKEFARQQGLIAARQQEIAAKAAAVA